MSLEVRTGPNSRHRQPSCDMRHTLDFRRAGLGRSLHWNSGIEADLKVRGRDKGGDVMPSLIGGASTRAS